MNQSVQDGNWYNEVKEGLCDKGKEGGDENNEVHVTRKSS